MRAFVRAAALLVGVIGFAAVRVAEASPIYVDQAATYKYINATAATTGVVAPNWFAPSFNDSGWFTGQGVFSSGAPSGTIVDAGNVNGPFAPGATDPVPSTYTRWDVGFDPYLRTSFSLAAPTALTLWIAVDNGINSMYLNGIGATVAPINGEGNAFRWEYVFDIPSFATVSGVNVFGLQLEDHGGLTGFDMMITGNDAATHPVFTTATPVPEPTALVLLGTGLAGALARRRRRR